MAVMRKSIAACGEEDDRFIFISGPCKILFFDSGGYSWIFFWRVCWGIVYFQAKEEDPSTGERKKSMAIVMLFFFLFMLNRLVFFFLDIV